MHAGQASTTAMLTARARARHQLIDEPRVFDDPIAVRIVGESLTAELTGGSALSHDVMSTAGRGALVARSRVAEDTLHEAVQRGVRQYVVLGAGLDTFAYRNPYPAAQLRVFEVDHPATQAWKQQLLRDNGIAVPPTLRFVSMDFTAQPLMQVLRDAGLRSDEPVLFSWLGVSMYLEPETALDTLRHIAGCRSGSGVVFDFLYRPPAWDLPGRLLRHALSRRYAAMGEPWVGFFEPRALMQAMRGMGYSELRHITRRELNVRLFGDRRDGLRIRAERLGGMMVATV